ncbi:hypothetical protein Lal_00030113 [Lupinus albus]|nr:hypothetical protein Lal_00030113 [Lupinus albus]
MADIASSSSRLMDHRISISHVIESVDIDTSNEDIIGLNTREHLIDDSLIHKMNYQTMIEISDEEEDAIPTEQTQELQPNEAPTMSQEPSFHLDQLHVMVQRPNEHIDIGMQAMEDRMQSKRTMPHD